MFSLTFGVSNMYESFLALAQGVTDFDVSVIETNQTMTICTTTAAVYITKEQAMQFFGLVEQPTESHST